MLLKRAMCMLGLMMYLLLSWAAGEENEGDFSALYPDKFLPEGSAPIVGENTYQSQDVNLTISSCRVGKSDVYVVDVYVRTVECLQRVHAGGAYGKTTAKVRVLAEESNAIVAITGDSSHYFSKGWTVSNGVVNRDTANRVRDIAILYRSGEMVGVDSAAVDNDQIRQRAEAGDIWQLFLFGPNLLDGEGKARPKADFEDSNVRYANPRSAIGYYAPGHYCLVQVDGRNTKSALESGTKSVGLELHELATLMEDLGCQAAYNLDGGQSSMLWYNGAVISTPYNGGRNVGDVVIIKDVANGQAPAESDAE